MKHYLTRAVLDHSAPEHALRPLLDPDDKGTASDAHHRLIWTLFPSGNSSRDFLWRANGKGKFYILSARKPLHSRIFRPLESRLFSPVLAVGDRLQFVLRANATKDRRSVNTEKVKPGTTRRPAKDRRVDIVMHALREQGIDSGTKGKNSRASRRMDVAHQVSKEWLSAQGRRRGFLVNALVVDDYRVSILKRRTGSDATFGVLDLRGVLTVRDPKLFFDTLVSGLGRSRAFGCGLMLVRRIRNLKIP